MTNSSMELTLHPAQQEVQSADCIGQAHSQPATIAICLYAAYRDWMSSECSTRSSRQDSIARSHETKRGGTSGCDQSIARIVFKTVMTRVIAHRSPVCRHGLFSLVRDPERLQSVCAPVNGVATCAGLPTGPMLSLVELIP